VHVHVSVFSWKYCKQRYWFLHVLAQEGLLNTDNNNPDYRFYVSDIPLKFRTIGERFLGRTMEQIEMVSLG